MNKLTGSLTKLKIPASVFNGNVTNFSLQSPWQMRMPRNRRMTWEPSSQTASFRTQNTWLFFLRFWRQVLLQWLSELLYFCWNQHLTHSRIAVFFFFRSLTFMSVGLAWSCWLRSWKTRVPKFRVSFWSARWVSPSSPPTIKQFASINMFDSGPQAFMIRPDQNAEDISRYLAWLTRTTTVLLRSPI